MTNGQARKAALAHVAGLVFNRPLAVTADRVTEVLAVLGPRLVGDVEASAVIRAQRDPSAREREALQVTSAGIAVIPVMGTFVKRASSMDAMSGLTSYEQVGAMAMAARDDSRVHGILLQLDSPGGQVNGMFELVALLTAIGKQKPIFAVADEHAYSAAYALAATAERLFVAATGGVGSIGVIAVRLDQTAADAKAGFKFEIVAAGARKSDGNPHVAMGDEERDALQAKVDTIDAMFLESVATHRRLRVEDLAALEAATFLGAEGVTAGLADEVGTVDDALRALTTRITTRASVRVAAAQHKEGSMGTEPETPVVEGQGGAQVIDLEAQKRLRAEGSATARKETAEIVDLCALAGVPERAAEFLARESVTAAQVRTELLDVRAKATEQAPVTNHVGANRGGSPPVVIDASAIYARRRAAIARAQGLRVAAGEE